MGTSDVRHTYYNGVVVRRPSITNPMSDYIIRHPFSGLYIQFTDKTQTSFRWVENPMHATGFRQSSMAMNRRPYHAGNRVGTVELRRLSLHR